MRADPRLSRGQPEPRGAVSPPCNTLRPADERRSRALVRPRRPGGDRHRRHGRAGLCDGRRPCGSRSARRGARPPGARRRGSRPARPDRRRPASRRADRRPRSGARAVGEGRHPRQRRRRQRRGCDAHAGREPLRPPRGGVPRGRRPQPARHPAAVAGLRRRHGGSRDDRQRLLDGRGARHHAGGRLLGGEGGGREPHALARRRAGARDHGQRDRVRASSSASRTAACCSTRTAG